MRARQLLSWVLWLYSGISSLGALAGEVAEPGRTYPRAIGILLPLVVTLNLAPFVVALSLTTERAHVLGQRDAGEQVAARASACDHQPHGREPATALARGRRGT